MNIVVTGASRGIGYETARLLSKEHTVVAVARSAEKNKLPGIISINFDLETGDIQKELIPLLKKHIRHADVLINNAATFIKKPFTELSPDDFGRIFRVNVFAAAELTRALLPMMERKTEGVRPHVVNIASMGGIQGSMKFPGLSAYSSSKGALITLTECLAEEYKEKGISFNALAFGSVQTEMLAAAFPRFKAPMSAAQAAEFVCHFALNGTKYFNGKILQLALTTP